MELTHEQQEHICDLFENENDYEALTELYNLTQDSIVYIALKWNKNSELPIHTPFSYSSYMYDDIIGYIYNRFLE